MNLPNKTVIWLLVNNDPRVLSVPFGVQALDVVIVEMLYRKSEWFGMSSREKET